MLNSPYKYPSRHWKLDASGQPTTQIVDTRRRAEFITPIPKPKKRRRAEPELVFDEGRGLSTAEQQYDRAKIIITNYDAFKRRERLELSKGGRSLLQGRGAAVETLETEGQMLQRVMSELMGMKQVLVINDEAHHCYREKVQSSEEGDLKGDDRKEAEKNREAARLWISGLETVQRKIGIRHVLDLSATPFFLSGSGYAEGTLFPWTMSDVSLMDAIECEIVKLPRVPVAGITLALLGEHPITALLDPYNPTGPTSHVNFSTSKCTRWETDARRCHVNWDVCDSDWEAEFCRVVESHPNVRVYVKNQGLGLEVPYRHGSEGRTYLPDFVVLVDDGAPEDDPLHLVVEVKGYRREDAKDKKSTMDAYWVPGVNHHGGFGRWAFAELTEVYLMDVDFEASLAAEVDRIIETAGAPVGEAG